MITDKPLQEITQIIANGVDTMATQRYKLCRDYKTQFWQVSSWVVMVIVNAAALVALIWLAWTIGTYI